VLGIVLTEAAYIGLFAGFLWWASSGRSNNRTPNPDCASL
jgi:hypothetical protein